MSIQTTNLDRLSLIVVGASGDLARTKLFPALFALHIRQRLPSDFRVFGFARSAYSDDSFRAMLAPHLRYGHILPADYALRATEFLERCHYVSGDYASASSFLDLYETMRRWEGPTPPARLFYLAIPPSVFMDVARSLGAAGLVSCEPHAPWTRVIIEKPFGHDRESSDRLERELSKIFTEDQIFRMDHYLGKEMIQNLMVLRFANLVFEPLWNRAYVQNIQISWKEDFGVRNRGNYFDRYGIIRDVVQNHLLQILALVAMEPPAGLAANCVRAAKVAILRATAPAALGDTVLGQYVGIERNGQYIAGYREEKDVPPLSRTPTFVAMVLKIQNQRWYGVPFFITAGKGLNGRMTEIRIRFREVPEGIYCAVGACPEADELVIRVQPEESIFLRIITKKPGLGLSLEPRKLDMVYPREEMPDAYESLLLDVIRSEKGLFISAEELAAAWDVVTPLLHEIDRLEIEPEPYEFGGSGPRGLEHLAIRFSVDLRPAEA